MNRPRIFLSEIIYLAASFIARTDKTISSAQFLPFATPCQSLSCPDGRVDFSIMIGNILSHSRVRKSNVVYHNGIRGRAACSTFDIHTPGSPAFMFVRIRVWVRVCMWARSRVCPKHFPVKLGSARHLLGVFDKFRALSLQQPTPQHRCRGFGGEELEFLIQIAISVR